MSKEFLYNTNKMNEVSGLLQGLCTNLAESRTIFTSAKASIDGMETLGFLNTKHTRTSQIEANVLNSILVGLEDFQKMIEKNALDVESTDERIANQIEGGSK